MSDYKNTVEAKCLNILLAEDEPSNLLLIDRMLKQAGHNITTAEDGEEAFQYLNTHEYDIGIFDLHMPVMGGIGAIELFKEKYPTNTMPFIILTAETGSDAQEQCKKAGVKVFLEKPITANELIKAIENI